MRETLRITIQQKFTLHAHRWHTLQTELKFRIGNNMLQYGLGYLIVAGLYIHIRVLQQH